MGRAITRVRFLTPPDLGVPVEEGFVEGRSSCVKIRAGLIAKEVPVGVRKWQSKRRASRTGMGSVSAGFGQVMEGKREGTNS